MSFADRHIMRATSWRRLSLSHSRDVSGCCSAMTAHHFLGPGLTSWHCLPCPCASCFGSERDLERERLLALLCRSGVCFGVFCFFPVWTAITSGQEAGLFKPVEGKPVAAKAASHVLSNMGHLNALTCCMHSAGQLSLAHRIVMVSTQMKRSEFRRGGVY